jgi:hypothetical protein
MSSRSPLDPRVVRILMDIAGRLSVLEAGGELRCAQMRELITKVEKLADENRQWRRNYEVAIRKKEAAWEAIGKLAARVQFPSIHQYVSDPDPEDIARALREMNS